MAYELGVAVIHGIGEQKQDFADEMIREVSNRLGARARLVCWKPIWWAELVEPLERDLLARLGRNHKLDWLRLRRFVVHVLADAVAYQRVPGESDTPGTYMQIHSLIAKRLTELDDEIRATRANPAADPPLVILAHSLGAHIMSNYLWDQQRPHEARGQSVFSPFVRGHSLAGIVTFGCNIPLFTLALPAVEPIQFPPPALEPRLKAVAKWLNLYDPDDILGYPLQPLSDAYARTVEDREVNAGSFLKSWNLLSHNEYWTDNDVTKPITEMIERVLTAKGSG